MVTELKKRYQQSEAYLEKTLKNIPLASQTFSKSLTAFPRGGSPFFIEKGKDQYVWDMDGNKYVDFINSLACITLGYSFKPVNDAVAKQLADGSVFSLPHRLENEVAELLIDLIPCAEMVRFGKTGSDATSGAIRLARAYTGREKIAACGYHGWQDWYIGTTARNLGVPKAVQELTKKFNFNDIQSLEKVFAENEGQMAAVILEPMNAQFPKDNFLQEIKKLCQKNGTVLIFDETITGFRYSNGGAQEYFDVTPDLATFGKGLANGFPLSAIVGKREIMKLMEDIFFSGTFGGETISLAAAKATINFFVENNVAKKLIEKGEKLINGVNKIIEEYNLKEMVNISGHPSWTFMNYQKMGNYTPHDLKTYHMQELLKRGFLISVGHNMSYSIQNEDIDKLLESYSIILPEMKKAIDQGKLDELIKCEKLVPLFQVR